MLKIFSDLQTSFFMGPKIDFFQAQNFFSWSKKLKIFSEIQQLCFWGNAAKKSRPPFRSFLATPMEGPMGSILISVIFVGWAKNVFLAHIILALYKQINLQI